MNCISNQKKKKKKKLMWSLRKTKIKLWLFWENGTFKEDMLRNILKTLKL